MVWKGERGQTLLQFSESLVKSALPIKFVCSDMWPAYLKVIKKKAVNALNILDRFHIMKKFNEAIDQIRRIEVKKLEAKKKRMYWLTGAGCCSNAEQFDPEANSPIKRIVENQFVFCKGLFIERGFPPILDV